MPDGKYNPGNAQAYGMIAHIYQKQLDALIKVHVALAYCNRHKRGGNNANFKAYHPCSKYFCYNIIHS